jgi:hypothetical protein
MKSARQAFFLKSCQREKRYDSDIADDLIEQALDELVDVKKTAREYYELISRHSPIILAITGRLVEKTAAKQSH